MALSEETMRRLRIRAHKRAMLTDPEYRRFMAEQRAELLEKRERESRLPRYREIWSAILWVERAQREAQQLVKSPANNGVFRKKGILGG